MDRKFSFRQVAAIAVAAVILSICATAAVFYAIDMNKSGYTINFDANKVSFENVKKFNQVRNILKDDYYQEVDENKLLEGAVSGLADALKDPYTVYFNKDQMKAFMEKSEGSYVGIGVTVSTDKDGLLTIIEASENSPAKQAGMIQGDKIVKVDEKDVTSLRDENMIISMIKGKENTKVRITVYRPGEGKYYQFDIVRKRIKASNIKSEILKGNIGYIKLVMFDSEIAGYFKNDLDQMLKKGRSSAPARHADR
jgi:carboxyl-terminal processing protease